MRMTQLFTQTRKSAPADEVSKNAQLLIRAGYIHKEMAGAYDYLPLGMRVIENVKQIVREEMNAIGGNEFLMTSLQRKDVWEKTDRWDEEKVDVWFKTKLQNGNELGLGWSHEEPITDLMTHHISSYKDLPAYAYQFQNKMRNELRAKSGIMRGREFIMKDLYSYSVSQGAHQAFYDSCIEAYHKVFDRLGIGDITYFTLADGGAFTKFSHEFQTICEAGEDVVYLDRKKKIAVNEEVMNDEVLEEQGLKREDLEEVKTAEVGNIFSFGDSKSKDLDLYFTDENGEKKPVILGSYGIGVTRVIGVITEIMADDAGLVWSEEIAPYPAHIVRIGDDKEVVEAADKLHEDMLAAGSEPLYDDRNERVGAMLSDADLIGIPKRIVISSKSLEAGGAEVKMRTESDSKIVPLNELM
jgi:prolyl-tRNA synthetase